MKVIKYVSKYTDSKSGYLSKEFDLVLNPEFAFKGTKKQLEQHIAKLSRKDGFQIIELESAKNSWDDWLQLTKTGSFQYLIKDDLLNVCYDPKVHTPENVLEQKLKMSAAEFKVEYSVYSTWPSLLAELFECLFSSGNNYVQIRIPKNLKYEVFEEEINLALKYLKPDENGFYKLDIIDHTLCEFGPTPTIKYKDSKFYLCEKYSAEQEKSLSDLLEYLKMHNWYDE